MKKHLKQKNKKVFFNIRPS